MMPKDLPVLPRDNYTPPENPPSVSDDDIPFRPIGGWALIEPIRRKATESGIALPDGLESAGEPPKGRVLALGPGEMTEHGITIPPDVSEGDVVYLFWPQYAARCEINVRGKRYIICMSKHIVGVCKE